MEMNRKKTKQVQVGGVVVGGYAPITIQSMTNTKTSDVLKTAAQINALDKAGCHIVRCSVYDMESARAIKEIKKHIKIPLVCDVHFDYRLAIESIKNGADKIRINPGNIGGAEKTRAVAEVAKSYGIPIRIGVNSGSLERDIRALHGEPTPEALVESALRNIKLLEGCNFYDIVLSIKSSDVYRTIRAYELASENTDYPLHIGVTEAGTVFSGGIKSAVGLGSLISHGIGDTLRVSLTGDPIEEVRYAREILKALGHKGFGPVIISCPTCARTGIDLIKIANEIERLTAGIDKDIKIAVMGCVVNGPNEAKDADIGIAAGDGCSVIFEKSKVIGKYKEDEIIDVLIKHIELL